MKKTFKNGAKIDTRPLVDKLKDWQQKEVVASAASVLWVEKKQIAWRQFPIFNQNGSGSCVAQTSAKEMGIMRWLKDKVYVHFSATDIYQRRSNKPESGMGGVDARSVIATGGATLEELTPSQSLSDKQMDEAIVEAYKRAVGDIFKVPNYLELTAGDIDSIASTIQATGKGVMVWFYFQGDEWTNRPVVKNPSLDLYAPSTLRHSITAVDFCLIDGVKCLIVEDSWGPGAGLGGQRIIDEAFFKARNWYASYLINFKFDIPASKKPKHTFNTDMEFGQNNGEIAILQDCLKYEKLFPINADSTGYYGAITQKAVRDFQIKYGIMAVDRVGPQTRVKLNELFI